MAASSPSAFMQLFEAGPANAPAQPDNWPMPVEQFVLGRHLSWGDVALSRNEYNPLSWLIRHATDANFAHAAMVFLEPNWQVGWQSTYLIESVFAGVEVTDIKDYFKHPRLSVAVRRLNHPWFSDRMRRRVRGRMLDDIKAEYAFSTLFGLGRQLLFGFESAARGHKQAVKRRLQRGINSPKEFICSGFIQRGYAQGIQEFIVKGDLEPTALKHVIFDPDLAAMLPDDWGEFTRAEAVEIIGDYLDAFQDELWATTPRDIEINQSFDWVYVITGGYAYQVSSYQDVCRLLRIQPCTR